MEMNGGYTKFDNNFLTGIYTSGLNGGECGVVLAVLRYTCGFNRSEHLFSYSFLEKVTGKSRSTVRRVVKKLMDMGIIREITPPTCTSPRVLSLNLGFFSDENGSYVPVGEENELANTQKAVSMAEEYVFSAENLPLPEVMPEGSTTESDVANSNVLEIDVAKSDVSNSDVANSNVSEIDVANNNVSKNDVLNSNVSKSGVAEETKYKPLPSFRPERGALPASQGGEKKETEASAADKDEKKAFGRFENVMLTEGERLALDRELGDKAEEMIEDFSMKLKAKGYNYRDHYAALLVWDVQNRIESRRQPKPPVMIPKASDVHQTEAYGQDTKEKSDEKPMESGFDTDEFFKIAVESSYRDIIKSRNERIKEIEKRISNKKI